VRSTSSGGATIPALEQATEHSDHIDDSVEKNGARGERGEHSHGIHGASSICDAAQSVFARLKKNEQGSGPCSENCVDPL
jgi:hypothetical protein